MGNKLGGGGAGGAGLPDWAADEDSPILLANTSKIHALKAMRAINQAKLMAGFADEYNQGNAGPVGGGGEMQPQGKNNPNMKLAEQAEHHGQQSMQMAEQAKMDVAKDGHLGQVHATAAATHAHQAETMGDAALRGAEKQLEAAHGGMIKRGDSMSHTPSHKQGEFHVPGGVDEKNAGWTLEAQYAFRLGRKAELATIKAHRDAALAKQQAKVADLLGKQALKQLKAAHTKEVFAEKEVQPLLEYCTKLATHLREFPEQFDMDPTVRRNSLLCNNLGAYGDWMAANSAKLQKTGPGGLQESMFQPPGLMPMGSCPKGLCEPRDGKQFLISAEAVESDPKVADEILAIDKDLERTKNKEVEWREEHLGALLKAWDPLINKSMPTWQVRHIQHHIKDREEGYLKTPQGVIESTKELTAQEAQAAADAARAEWEAKVAEAAARRAKWNMIKVSERAPIEEGGEGEGTGEQFDEQQEEHAEAF